MNKPACMHARRVICFRSVCLLVARFDRARAVAPTLHRVLEFRHLRKGGKTVLAADDV